MAKSPVTPSSSWRERYKRNVRIFYNSRCIPCRKLSFFTLIHQKNQLRNSKSQPTSKKSKKPTHDLPPYKVPTLKLPAKSTGVSSGRQPGKRFTAAADVEPALPNKKSSTPRSGATGVESAQSNNKPGKRRPSDAANEESTLSNKKPRTQSTSSSPVRPSPTVGKPPTPLITSTPNVIQTPLAAGSKPSGKPNGKPNGKPDSKPTTPTIGFSGSKIPPTALGPISQPSPRVDSPHFPGAEKPASSTPSKVSRTWPVEQQVRGLHNPGAFCYRNSCIQSLFSVPQLLNLLESFHGKTCKKSCVVCALRDLAVAYHREPKKSVGKEQQALNAAVALTEEKLVVKAIQRNEWKKSQSRNGKKSLFSPIVEAQISNGLHWNSNGNSHEDSNEFLMYLFEHLENAPGISKSVLNSLYGIRDVTEWTCNICKKKHVNPESAPSTCLVLDIETTTNTLSKCIDARNRTNDCEIRCDGCKDGKDRPRTRVTSFTVVPEILYISFQRTRISANGRAQKNAKNIQIPEYLDMSRWALKKEGNMRYRLSAAVSHRGDTANGHYIAHVRKGDQWRRISDFDNSKAEFSHINQPTRIDKGFLPFYMTYVKIDDSKR